MRLGGKKVSPLSTIRADSEILDFVEVLFRTEEEKPLESLAGRGPEH